MVSERVSYFVSNREGREAPDPPAVENQQVNSN